MCILLHKAFYNSAVSLECLYLKRFLDHQHVDIQDMWGSDIILSTNTFNCPISDGLCDVFCSSVVKTRPVVDIWLCLPLFLVPAQRAIRNAACRPPFPISCFISREICFLLAVIGIQAPPDVGIRMFNTIFYAGENAHILPFQQHII